jgi:outer membrane protein OmpA-like peptidoglycan-associated protein
MTKALARFSTAALVSGTILIGAAGLTPGSSHAQASAPPSRSALDATTKKVTATEIAEALRPKDLRSLGPAAPKENTAIVALTFETGSAELSEQSKVALREFGKAFKEFIPGVAVIIEGHADPRGGEEFNLELSRKRAAAVRDYLVKEFGNDPKQFQVIGFGQTRLMDPSNPAADVNRRVEFVTKNFR